MSIIPLIEVALYTKNIVDLTFHRLVLYFAFLR